VHACAFHFLLAPHVHPHTIDEPTVPPVQFTAGHKLVESIFQTHLFGSIDYSIILSNPPPHGGELSETTHQNSLMAKRERFFRVGVAVEV